MIGNDEFTAGKNRKKRFRVVLQLAVLAVLAAVCINALVSLKSFRPQPAPLTPADDYGFIALSYFGVDRVGSQGLIGAQQLREQLQALHSQGYVTITQQDIIDYYRTGKSLPAKSLFLLFEDGRRDTAIFAQKSLEKLNYKATMLTYPENFAKRDAKFLTAADLRDLEATTFWEMGTNGYRLAFINVFDRYENYLGELDPLQHAEIAPYMGRKYNHYLMDFIRDEYGIPRESFTGMTERISGDYRSLSRLYRDGIGYVPGLYSLMHSNTGSFGNNDYVSAVNEFWIYELFKMNFNREGFSLNRRNSSVYDLTRMQPQAYWSVNHLLMRIKYDTNREIEFVNGDPRQQSYWDTLHGAAEMKEGRVILTSLPQAKGLLRLKDKTAADLRLSVRLQGNKLGQQKIYLRADEALSRYVAVSIADNVLYVSEKTDGEERNLFVLDLSQHDGIPLVSLAEDKKAAELQALKTLAKYASSLEQAKTYSTRYQKKSREEAASVAAGAEPYRPDLSVHERGDRQLILSLQAQSLSIELDGKPAVTGLAVPQLPAGLVYLESAWGGYGWSQRNLADDVYDGVFANLRISQDPGTTAEKVLFDARPQGLDAVRLQLKQYWQALINWFISTF
ncbi:MAG: glycoside hydrolase [Sporomusaceae bacterium]|nr:glycoside hydrolase [Sporomusaceae bacterium]